MSATSSVVTDLLVQVAKAERAYMDEHVAAHVAQVERESVFASGDAACTTPARIDEDYRAFRAALRARLRAPLSALIGTYIRTVARPLKMPNERTQRLREALDAMMQCKEEQLCTVWLSCSVTLYEQHCARQLFAMHLMDLPMEQLVVLAAHIKQAFVDTAIAPTDLMRPLSLVAQLRCTDADHVFVRTALRYFAKHMQLDDGVVVDRPHACTFHRDCVCSWCAVSSPTPMLTWLNGLFALEDVTCERSFVVDMSDADSNASQATIVNKILMARGRTISTIFETQLPSVAQLRRAITLFVRTMAREHATLRDCLGFDMGAEVATHFQRYLMYLGELADKHRATVRDVFTTAEGPPRPCALRDAVVSPASLVTTTTVPTAS